MSTTLTEAVKVEVNPEPARACRVCLAWDVKLHNIHEWGLGDMYTEITGTTLSVWDGFPQHVCAWCRAQLLRAQALRERSRRADALLKQALMHQHFITDSFIRTIDRSLNKLTHTLTDNSSENTALYYCVYDDDTQEDTDIKQCLIENVHKKDTENYSEDDLKVLDLDCDEDHMNEDFPSQLSPDLDVQNTNLGKLDDKIINKETVEPNSLDVKVVATSLELNETKVAKPRKKPAQNGGQAKRKRNIKAKANEGTANDVKVRKRKPQKFTEKFCTEEEIKEYEEKFSVELKFLTEEEMLKDMEDRKNSDTYLRSEHKCELCFKGFSAATSYNNHMKSHAEVRGEHECYLCHWRYGNPGKLRGHMRYLHRIKFHCTLCGKVILGPDNVELHAAFHAGTHFKCQYCDKHFQRKTSCWTHMRLSHQQENFESSCELCGEIFTSKKGLKSHKTRSHRETVDNSLSCRKCRMQFDSKEALQRHKDLQPGQRCHNNQSSCQQCGAVCPGENALAQHKYEAHGVELFTCHNCNKSFLSKTSLSVHIDRLHLKLRSRGPRGRYTNYTPMLTDPGEKRRDYVCEECGKAYTYYSLLKQHQMARHTAPLPYKCDQCPRGFARAVLLRKHIDCIHKRLRKWRCPECPKTFLHQSSVTTHRLIHIGKKTQICTYCGKAFLQSGSLITHVKYVHLKIPAPPRKRNKKKNA